MIEPEDFLELADRLKQISNDEATYRTAISRYYYAAFLKIRTEFKAKLGSINNKVGVSNFIQDAERKNPHSFYILLISLKSKYLAELLYTLRFLRNQSDYDIHKNIEPKHVEASEKYSKKIIEKTHQTIQALLHEIETNPIGFYNEINQTLRKAGELLDSFRMALQHLELT